MSQNAGLSALESQVSVHREDARVPTLDAGTENCGRLIQLITAAMRPSTSESTSELSPTTRARS